MNHLILRSISLAALLTPLGALCQGVDPALPDYQKASGVSGSINSVGSDTLANLMTFWAEEFKKLYPNVNVQIQAAGSSTAPPALTEGTSNLGPMSRPMKAEEIAAFESKHGYKPTEIGVAIDALAVFVHKDNPVQCLSVPQVDAIFSATRKCGHSEDITRWNQVGVTGALADQSMQLYGRNSVSGTYGFFKENALCKGDYKDTVNEQPGSASVVQGVTKSVNGIGYSGIGYKTSGVKAISLSAKEGGECVPNTPENAVSGKFPLARLLYVYVNKAPNKPLSPLEGEFIRMVLSKIGQEVVVKDGYIPLPAAAAAEQLAKIGAGGAGSVAGN
ncbi:MAG TPA: phosphate ABC transporter substrate-binding protein PstS family protein [Gammaproteobacteria bacterium]|jgi:phosphate transport system substrate-binding protein